MRFVQPTNGDDVPENILAPPNPCPGVEAFYVFDRRDELSPRYNTTYFLSDITPVLNNSSFYEEDVKSHPSVTITWEICSYVNGRDTISDGPMSHEPALLPKPPALGSTLVSNGGTPPADGVQDYIDWYNLEHSAKLSLVPGWNNCRRYAHEKGYGEPEGATFYGWNFYDEENGLEGPEWWASMTEWTERIRGNAKKPNYRRVWKVIKTSQA